MKGKNSEEKEKREVAGSVMGEGSDGSEEQNGLQEERKKGRSRS